LGARQGAGAPSARETGVVARGASDDQLFVRAEARPAHGVVL